MREQQPLDAWTIFRVGAYLISLFFLSNLLLFGAVLLILAGSPAYYGIAAIFAVLVAFAGMYAIWHAAHDHLGPGRQHHHSLLHRHHEADEPVVPIPVETHAES
jgi:hypothetical protein